MPHPIDGGRRDRPRLRPESPDALPCENDQAKPDRFSRLARSTLLSKILTTLRLSGAVWIEAQSITTECPRTCCACRFSTCQRAAAFLREPFKVIEVRISCQHAILRGSSSSTWIQNGMFSSLPLRRASIWLGEKTASSPSQRTAQILKERPAFNA